MGFMQDGIWKDEEHFPTDEQGAFIRQSTSFRDSVGKDHPNFQPDANRYHLYVSLACPWAHRTLIMRSLKGLENIISVSVVHPHMLDQGWSFAKDFPDAHGDPIYQCRFLHEIYAKAKSDYTGRVTVPLLWDKKTKRIVNNESADIIRILNLAFTDFSQSDTDFYPEEYRSEIDQLNDWIYENVNNGVYRAGFANTQESYERAVVAVFNALDLLEKRLGKQALLLGDKLCESDIRLYTTLVRFDPVYHYHFKCNLKKISDYPNLSRYLQHLSRLKAFHDTTNMEHIKAHYYYSHKSLNPFRIIPLGPK
ncbi:MAG: glutathione S-transferase family protein [Oligoflexus sp.]